MNKIFIFISLLIVLSSCESLVQIDTPDGQNNITVEVDVTTESRPWEVRISMSQSYYNLEPVSNVDNALVTIADNEGNKDTLQYVSDGVYRTTGNKAAVPGRTYELNIWVDGEYYEAFDYCRPQYQLDTVAAYFLPNNNGFIQSGWYVFEKANEMEGDGDCYEWIITRNDTVLTSFGFILDQDEFRDNSYFNLQIDKDDPLSGLPQGILPRPFPFSMNPGDVVTVEQRCINKGYFDYLTMIQTQLNNSGTPFDSPPANAISNISNGAFGYFNVMNVVKGEVVIPE